MKYSGNPFSLKHISYGLLSLAALLPLTVQARHLQPQEALRAVTQETAAKAPGVQTSAFSLAYEVPNATTNEAAVYVFSQTEGGFIVVAADDDVSNLLLGYSETAKLDPSNLPPSFVWALGQYAAYVRDASENMLADSGPSKLPANYSAISPICQTTWDQSTPYNNDCPMVNNKRAVTGCVATAMAQLMKVHNWPTTGTGNKSYTFSSGSLTDSFDFGNTTFDWDNMLNSYSGDYTQAQGDAVATLMHACGVAAEMDYSSTGSGASDFVAAMGVIEYMKYDKALTYYMRNWFTSSEWENLIYSQLSEGLPVMICGNDGQDGHAFVCDGCNDSNYYHINWGWSGYCDGYFSLADLNPGGTGIGGGTGEEGFNLYQSVLINVKPDTGSSNYTPVFAVGDCLAANQNQYARYGGNYVEFAPTDSEESEGGFWSWSMGDIPFTLGFKLDIAGGPQYIEVVSNTCSPMTGYTSLGVPTTSFPVGEYDVSAVYKAYDGDWTPMYYDKTLSDGALHFVVEDDQITITQGTSSISSIAADNDVPVYYNLQGIKMEDNPGPGIYIRVLNGNATRILLK